jgi:hypothetical protein
MDSDELLEIVKKLAESDPVLFGSSGDPQCSLCDSDDYNGRDGVNHKPDCLFIRARAYIEQQPKK